MHNEIILRPEFSPSLDRYAHSIRLEALEDVKDQALEIFTVASQTLKPKAIITTRYIDSYHIENDLPTITVDHASFSGKALSVLHDVHRVFPYIATCGDEMENYDYSHVDWMAPYWVDAIKLQALGAARNALIAYLKETFHIKKPLSLNPGSGNVDIWPIEQQEPLFSLLSQGSSIGVRLTESFLMVPNKSISGFMFVSPSTDYESCAYCERQHCPDRRVPFIKSL